jgi:hypothetical protein
VAVLLVGTGSFVSEEPVAVFAIVPLTVEATAPVTVTVADAPTANAPSEQLARAQLPCEGTAPTRVTPAGSVSTRLAAVVSDGPRFVTVTSQVAFEPATTAPTAAFETRRSATRRTTVSTDAVLFVVIVSAVVDTAEAVFDSVVPSAVDAATVPVTEIDTIAPGDSVASVHVTVEPATEQLPAVGVAAIPLTPVGSVSETTTD